MSKTITSAEYNAWLEHPLTKGLKRSFEQSVTDPENQPSQYGTVTLEMYEALESEITTLKSALKVARDTIKYYSSVCGEDDQPTPAKEAIVKIEGVLK